MYDMLSVANSAIILVDKKENRMTLKIMWNMDPMGLSISAQGTSIGNA